VPFNIPLPLHLKGAIELPSLERALSRVVARHESLRTSFASADGQPYQVIAGDARTPLELVDLRYLDADERRRELVGRLIDAAGQPFDLGQSPLIRLIVYQIADDEHVFFFVAHHIVFDGHSVGVFARDLTALYAAEVSGAEPGLPELSIQYADYAAWQRRVLSGDFLEAELGYWRQQLADYPTGLNLPTRRRAASDELYRGDTVAALLSEEQSAALRALAQREGVTLFMLLLAAFKALLTRYSGQEDIIVGTPVANRNQPEMADVIGFCVNMLALRTNLAGNPTFRELLSREREVCLAAYTHQEVPLGLLVQHLRPDRHISHSPFFSIGFVLQPAPPQTEAVDGFALAPAADEDAQALLAELDRRRGDVTPATDLLFLQTADTGRQIAAVMQHSSAAFSSATIERMLGHYERLLAAIVDDPGCPIWDLPLLAADERSLLVENFSRGQVFVPPDGQTGRLRREDVCLHQLVEAQAERTPDATAVVLAVPPDSADEADCNQSLTYDELNRRANQLAHQLISLGVGPESRVAVLLDRTPSALIALLGVLKAGGAFVPLDANYPRERMALLFGDARPPVVVTLEKFAQDVPLDRSRIVCLDGDAPALSQQSIDNPASGVQPDNAAYVIYTSGSTGRPKGVVVPHRSVVNHNLAAASRFGLTSSDRVLQFHSISFDAAIEEIFPTWLCGATLMMRGADLILPGAELHHFIRRYGVTVLDLPTAYWHQWVDQAQQDQDVPGEPLRLVIVGGDEVSPERYTAWQTLAGERIRWLNTYGPTETTIISTCDEPTAGPIEADADWSTTIGRPIDHTQAYVLDPRLEPTPIGVPGELYLGGRGVARGYHERPALTAERFVPDPLGDVPGARLYRTGDRARYRPDGRIEFLGRIDQQLKIRGFRVEPGEIVAALREHPGVREALVVGHGEAGDKRLVAYVAKCGGDVSPDDLRAFLEGKLPGYMVPSAFIILDDFPLTPGGKIDRRALPDPSGLSSELSVEYVAPQTATEIELARIWRGVLEVERVGTRDNFFALGGHSLLAAKLVARVRREMAIDLPLRALFEHPTVAGLAQAIDQGLIARLAGDADLDLAREATLADDIAPAGIATRSSDEPRAILLTGATGFLGAYLLHELLARTSADIYCLVRADDEAQARERLQTALARFDLGDESAAPRIVPVLGDLAETRLGLTDERFQALAESIDVVYHNGAWVNFIYPYAMLKQANVGGTEEVLRLACRAKLKPVHYVSTLSVFPGNRWAEGSVVESFRVDLGSGVRGGYAQSKWVAERLVALAAERGVPVTIHRPGRVTGDSRTGATYETAGLENLNSLLSLGVIPRVDWPTTLDIVPVDYVARAIVELASRPGSLGQAFHLNNPHPGSWPDLVAAFRRAGYQLREIEPRKWAAQVYQFIRATPTHALHEALPFVPPEISEMLDRWGQDGNAQAEESLLAPDAGAAEQRPPATADCRNVVALLAGTPFECPPAADLLDVYIGYFLRLGVLAPPEACSAIDDSRLSDRPSMAECPSP
jgi:amino acid adenylation domain-containing protein/thioester reductase-like protein